jgi:hypothetical protein
MAITSCSELRESLLDYFRAEVEVSDFKDRCVLTLPMKTVDERLVDVTVERKMPDYFLVHDAGKSLSELFTQGISLTEAKRKNLEDIAKINGATLVRDVFTIGCASDKLQNAIIAIGLCSTMAMVELIGHKPEFEEEPLPETVNRSLKQWRPSFVTGIDRRVTVRGRRFPHSFDFVVFPADEPIYHTTAIKLLPPSYGGQIQAERFAYLVLDIEGTPYDQWSRLAILSKVEMWPLSAIKMITSLSNRTIELRSGEEPQVETLLPSYMDQLIISQ